MAYWSPEDSPRAMPTPPKPVLMVFHESCSTGGIFPRLLGGAGLPVIAARHRFGDPLPPVDSVSAAIFFGGSASANDVHHPWLAAERQWMAHALDLHLPQLGICLGGQLMASLLGARVHRLPGHSLECGYYPVEGLPGSALPRRARAYQWHREQFDLPSTATALVRGSEWCPVQAFAFESLLALQFHPEVDEASIQRWLRRDKVDLESAHARPANTHLPDHARHAPLMEEWCEKTLIPFLGGQVLGAGYGPTRSLMTSGP